MPATYVLFSCSEALKELIALRRRKISTLRIHHGRNALTWHSLGTFGTSGIDTVILICNIKQYPGRHVLISLPPREEEQERTIRKLREHKPRRTPGRHVLPRG